MAVGNGSGYHRGMPTSVFLIITATLVFALAHSLLATQACKQKIYARGLSPQHYRLLYVIVAILLTGLWLAYIYSLPDRLLYRFSGNVRAGAIIIQGLALFLLWQSLRPIDVPAFLGLRPFADNIEPFIERGIYRHIRHPMYSSVLLLLAAAPEQSYNSVTLLAAVAAYFFIGARFEERRLLHDHPAYADYRRRVPAFIPFPGSHRQCRQAKIRRGSGAPGDP
jgi:protein-S-isoprenylcysteine O-methyltransferase Ste14